MTVSNKQKTVRSETKLTIRQRVKNVAKRVGGAIKRVATKIRAKTKAVALRAWAKAATAWRKALRPFLKAFGALVAGIMWVSTLVAAPLTTVAVTAGAGVLLIGLARLLEALDGSNKRIAKLAIQVIEAIAQALRAAFYLWSAAVAVLTLPAWGPIAAVMGLTFLALKALPRSEMLFVTPMPTAVDAMFEREAAVRRRKIEVVDATIEPVKTGAIQAKGTEEVQDMPACDNCRAIGGLLRIRTNDIRFATLPGWEPEQPPIHGEGAWLCETCFDAECEDNAIALTGVSLKKTSVEVRLTEVGLAATSEYAASLTDDNVHWAPTAWWRDKMGVQHDREWSGFVHGEVVANVVFDYRRGTYRLLVMGKPPRDVGAQRDRISAQRLATDLWNDAVLRLESEIAADRGRASSPAIKAV